MGHMELSLAERLRLHSEEGPAPLHMPGHKRNAALAPYLELLGARWDVTELPGLDDLHDPEGVLAEAMDRCQRLCGAGKSFFLVNGSTGGLHAAIRAATRKGDRVLVARNCHKAVYHALELCALEPVFLQPPEVAGFGCAGAVCPGAVREKLEASPGVRLVILTSPTYEGIVSDVAGICQAAREKGIPVLVDEAHGAHLGLYEGFPQSAVQCGADLVVQSFHKTLPSLTQSAVLHVSGNRVDGAEVARNLSIFQTSSPSYLLLSSLDGCVRLLEKEGAALCAAWLERRKDFDLEIAGLRHFQVLGHGRASGSLAPLAFALDPSKLVISTRGTSLSGVRLMELLAEDYGLQLEMALEDYAIAMTGMGDRPEWLSRLALALAELDETYGTGARRPVSHMPPLGERVCTLEAAMVRPWRQVAGEEAAGQISADYLWAYPPGIPLVIPGERLGRDLVERIAMMQAAGVYVVASRGVPGKAWAVLDGL